MSLPFLPPDFLDDWGWAHVKPPVLRRGRIVAARAEDLYPELSDVRLTIMDGPYGKGKADWDRVKDLRAWYAPHIEGVSRCSAASASVYFYNTFDGVLKVHHEWESRGWDLAAWIIWDKGVQFLQSNHADLDALRSWKDVTEVAVLYQRETVNGVHPIEATNASDRNTVRVFLCAEQARSGLPLSQLKAAMKAQGAAGEMIVRHSFYESQWCFPTFDQWAALHRVWNMHGRSEGRPYLQVHDTARVWNQDDPADYEALRADYEALRADYEALRVPFFHPMSTTNVWDHPMVQGPERLRDAHGKPLHPCQKPLLFAERMIRASSRPGELVFEPFGGTCRAAVACELLPEAEARRYVCVEPNESYIAGAMADIERRRATA